MGTQAQQALEERRSTPSGSAADNSTGTRRAQAVARRKSSQPKFNRVSKQAPKKAIQPDPNNRTRGDNINWASGQPMPYSPIAEHGVGGVGTSKAQQKASARADARRMTQDLIGAVGDPNAVRASGNIWDDPTYGPLANEHGAEYAMRARNLDRQVSEAQKYRQVRDQTLASELGRNAAKRQDLEGRIAAQDLAASRGTPEQVQEAFGGGSYRDAEGNIIRGPSASVTPEDGEPMMYDAQGNRVRAGDEQVVGRAPPSEAEAQQAERQQALTESSIESLTNILTEYAARPSASAEEKKNVQEMLKQLQGMIGGAAPTSDPASEKAVNTAEYGGKKYSVGDEVTYTDESGKQVTGKIKRIYADGNVEIE